MSSRFLCTRPVLAAQLQRAGAQATMTVNPFGDAAHKTAWYFDLNESTVPVILDFYRGYNKPLPKVVQAYLEGGADYE